MQAHAMQLPQAETVRIDAASPGGPRPRRLLMI
jgi:hypothetical protein